MKGLDGIQGPIYVGTGCVFRRQALFGYAAPKTKKPPTRTCNCWPKWVFCSCCSSRKKKAAAKSKAEKKRKTGSKKGTNTPPAFAIEKIEGCVEGIISGTINGGLVNGKSNPIISQEKLEKKFGQSPVFVASTLLEQGGTLKTASAASLLKEAIHVINCGYEDKTEWGSEVITCLDYLIYTPK